MNKSKPSALSLAFEKLRYNSSAFISLGLLFGFIAYWGYDIRSGGSIGTSSRFFLIRWITEGTELAADTYGQMFVGHAIIGLALAGFIGACTWIWRSGWG
ncbi:hypothetical protein EDD53_0521 [Pacificibacter maritimus]|uniref:Uncharacterized protein n=1 Tax=Pacificibacter maritimus TaxID=762213 RepID=A0A3N4ULT0_9RHOB|nr:hypothetical protein [Pacificibacter maritimus]RPE71403.1 hypothetical protein EDD53_0521 [Pacificibacter maritimus]